MMTSSRWMLQIEGAMVLTLEREVQLPWLRFAAYYSMSSTSSTRRLLRLHYSNLFRGKWILSQLPFCIRVGGYDRRNLRTGFSCAFFFFMQQIQLSFLLEMAKSIKQLPSTGVRPLSTGGSEEGTSISIQTNCHLSTSCINAIEVVQYHISSAVRTTTESQQCRYDMITHNL